MPSTHCSIARHAATRDTTSSQTSSDEVLPLNDNAVLKTELRHLNCVPDKSEGTDARTICSNTFYRRVDPSFYLWLVVNESNEWTN
jgi:hypothetical protein